MTTKPARFLSIQRWEYWFWLLQVFPFVGIGLFLLLSPSASQDSASLIVLLSIGLAIWICARAIQFSNRVTVDKQRITTRELLFFRNEYRWKDISSVDMQPGVLMREYLTLTMKDGTQERLSVEPRGQSYIFDLAEEKGVDVYPYGRPTYPKFKSMANPHFAIALTWCGLTLFSGIGIAMKQSDPSFIAWTIGFLSVSLIYLPIREGVVLTSSHLRRENKEPIALVQIQRINILRRRLTSVELRIVYDRGRADTFWIEPDGATKIIELLEQRDGNLSMPGPL